MIACVGRRNEPTQIGNIVYERDFVTLQCFYLTKTLVKEIHTKHHL